MNDKMKYYEAARHCPKKAQRTITAGKLKGKSDINPVWRIKQLTKMFGPVGLGWKLSNIRYWTEAGAKGEISAWCSLELQIKPDPTGPWSDGIEGVGGSMLVKTENGKLVTNDEAYKMAMTDAISVACKLLGIAADVYWQEDRTKYSESEPDGKPEEIICERCLKPIKARKHAKKLYSVADIVAASKKTYNAQLCWTCMEAEKSKQEPLAGDPNENAD